MVVVGVVVVVVVVVVVLGFVVEATVVSLADVSKALDEAVEVIGVDASFAPSSVSFNRSALKLRNMTADIVALSAVLASSSSLLDVGRPISLLPLSRELTKAESARTKITSRTQLRRACFGRTDRSASLRESRDGFLMTPPPDFN